MQYMYQVLVFQIIKKKINIYECLILLSCRWDENPPAVRARPEGDRVADKYHDQHVKNLQVMDMEAPPPTVRPTKVPVHLQESETP